MPLVILSAFCLVVAAVRGLWDFARLQWWFWWLRGERLRRFQRRKVDRMVRLAVDGADFDAVSATVGASLEAALTRCGCRLPAIEIGQAPPEVNRSSQKLQRVRRAFPHPPPEPA